MSISEHKHMPEPVRRIEVFTGAGRRRSWSAAEKAGIIAESYGTGETVCAVARRHGLTPQQLFAGRRLARRSALLPPPMFVPAVVETSGPRRRPGRRAGRVADPRPTASNSRSPGSKYGSERTRSREPSRR
jgi:transposase